MEELTAQKAEELRRLRDAIISPYIAQDWEVDTDYPNERRIVLKRTRKANGWLVFLGLLLYVFPGVLYYIIVKSIPEKKTLLY